RTRPLGQRSQASQLGQRLALVADPRQGLDVRKVTGRHINQWSKAIAGSEQMARCTGIRGGMKLPGSTCTPEPVFCAFCRGQAPASGRNSDSRNKRSMKFDSTVPTVTN